jgi:hypothetical protein
MDDLLDAIDRLTIGYTVTTVLDDGSKHHEHHDSLIAQLRAAIVSDVGSGVGGSQARERVPLDVDALTRYENLEGQVGAFLLEWSGERPKRGTELEKTLRKAYVAFIGKAGDKDVQRAEKRWGGWVRQIEEKLDGVNRIELMAPCPVCNFQWYVNADGRQEVALQVVYKPDGQSGLSETFALCRFCEYTETPSMWKGVSRLRELAYQLETAGHKALMVENLTIEGLGVS